MLLEDRITSYNVCYTKLLRITPIKVQEVRSNLLETVNRINNTRVELSDALREKFRTRSYNFV